jgi:hypothetical protein
VPEGERWGVAPLLVSVAGSDTTRLPRLRYRYSLARVKCNEGGSRSRTALVVLALVAADGFEPSTFGL